MKQITISLEHDIKRNQEYKNLQTQHNKTIDSTKADIRNIMHLGMNLERSYNIRKDAECNQIESEYINQKAAIQYNQYQQLLNELLKLKQENIILKQIQKELIPEGVKINIIGKDAN